MQNTAARRAIPEVVRMAAKQVGAQGGKARVHTPARVYLTTSKALQSSDAMPPEQPARHGLATRRRQNMLSPFRMIQEFDDIMRDFGITNLPRSSMIKPGEMDLAIDIAEKPDKFLIKADIPGMKASDVSLELSPEHILTISGERKHEHKEEEEGHYRLERSFGSFTRSFKIPDHVDATTIKAEANNGVLSITLPKVELEQEENKTISIAVSEGSNE